MTGHAVVVVLVGLIAGELADLVMKRRGYGLGGDVLFGIAGSLAGAALFNIFATMPGREWLPMVAAALTGAVVVIALQRTFWQART
jgi:uncharacterized membrane protein YeaQ/YmgE (transglycosylase-associated protein family)